MKPQSAFLLQKSVEFILNGNFSSAEIFLKQLIKTDKNNSEGYRYLGILHAFKKDFTASIIYLNKSLQTSPKNYLALTNMGSVLTKQKKFDEAVDFFKKALDINPLWHEAWSEKGLLNFEKRDYRAALLDYEKAISIEVNSKEAWLNKANVLVVLGQEEEAREIYQILISKFPKYYEARYNYGLYLLDRKEFRPGWIEYENRWFSSGFNSERYENNIKRWNSSSNTDGLLVWPEQGIGDQILYGSLLGHFQHESGVITVGLEKKLLPIFTRAFPLIQFIEKENLFESKYAKFTSQIPIASLSALYRDNIDRFPSNRGYLKADLKKVEEFKKSFKNLKKLKCGISWRSNNTLVGDEKSIPLNIFLKVFDNTDFEFINLQHDISEGELILIKKNMTLNNMNVDLYNDIDQTLSLIQACDFVVTASNTIAHLAGSIGKTALVLVPNSVGRFWYWHKEDKVSLWYPSVNIFKQNIQGDWSAPVINANIFLSSNFD